MDPKFQQARYGQYLKAVNRLDRVARENYGKRVLELAVRWTLDHQPFVTVALWGARHPDQLAPIADVGGWKLDLATLRVIDEIVRESVTDPVGPEFMAPPARSLAAVIHTTECIARTEGQALKLLLSLGRGDHCLS
jgi:hypothetical protein